MFHEAAVGIVQIRHFQGDLFTSPSSAAVIGVVGMVGVVEPAMMSAVGVVDSK